jgi:hypothetical protein
VALLVVAFRRRRLVAAAPRRRKVRDEAPLVVVAPDGEVRSSSLDVTEGDDPTDAQERA